VVDGNIDDFRYTGPEIVWPEESSPDSVDKILVTKESDIYGMGMVAYEVRFHRLVFILPKGRILRLSTRP
jgi:hypothetical protein